MRNRQFVFAPKIEYKLVADPPVGGEANQNRLIFPVWCRGRESNSHDLFSHKILSLARLPIPPPRHLLILTC